MCAQKGDGETEELEETLKFAPRSNPCDGAAQTTVPDAAWTEEEHEPGNGSSQPQPACERAIAVDSDQSKGTLPMDLSKDHSRLRLLPLSDPRRVIRLPSLQ